jgi:LCP family protein required for cell wall assembly
MQKRRRRTFLIVAAVLLLIAAIFTGIFAIYDFDVNKLPFIRNKADERVVTQPKERITTLVMVINETDASELLDAAVLVTYSPKTKKLDAISLPNNLMVEIPGQGVAELGQAYTQGKIALTKSTVELLLGIKVGYYIKLDSDGVKDVVDQIGGIELEGKKSGGKDAADFLNPRTKDEKELPRLERFNALMMALQRQANTDEVFDNLEKNVPELDGAYDADMSEAMQLDMARVMAALPAESFKAQTLPVKEVLVNQQVFYQPEKTAVEAMITRVFPELRQTAKKIDVKIRVLNGIGEPGIASDLSKTLTDRGYRIVDTKNADAFGYAETQIIVYSDGDADVAAAEKIKTLLGVGKIVVNKLPQDVADVTIIIGADYADKVRKYELLKLVEVLNGTARTGLAAEIAEKLKAGGVTVVNTGNADRNDYATTIITIYIDNPQVAKFAADIKGILGKGEITVSQNPRADIEISVTLGKDLE